MLIPIKCFMSPAMHPAWFMLIRLQKRHTHITYRTHKSQFQAVSLGNFVIV